MSETAFVKHLTGLMSCLGMLCVLAMPGSAQAGSHSDLGIDRLRNIYVSPLGDDGNSGSRRFPMKTIQAAVDKARPGWIINVQRGTYRETVLFRGNADSGTAAEPITLRGEPGAKISGQGIRPRGRKGLITIRDASHIVIDGMDLRRYRTPATFLDDATPVGILVYGTGSNITLSNNKIRRIENRSTCTQNNNYCYPGANGIGIYGDTPGGLTDIRLIGNEVVDNTLASSEAVTLNGNIYRFRVEDNYVHDNNNIGFDFIGLEADTCPSCTDDQNRARVGLVRGNRAENNTIASNPWYAGDDGNAGGFYVDGGEYIVFEQNVSTGNDLGIEVASEARGGTSGPVLIASNLIYENRELGLAVGGYNRRVDRPGGGSAEDVWAVNNTFYANRGWGTGVVLQYRANNFVFQNNMVYGQGGRSLSVELAEEPVGAVWDNNAWWGTGAINAIPVTDPNAVLTDPMLTDVAGGDFTPLPGSPLIDTGGYVTDIVSWTDPFWTEVYGAGVIPGAGTGEVNGDAREQGVIDIGAIEQ